MALELFDVALNEITDLKTEIYSLFSNLVEGADTPVKKTPGQRGRPPKRSKTTPGMEVESSKKDLTSTMEEEEKTPPKASKGSDFVIFINETAQKSKSNHAQSESTPPSTGVSKKKESLQSTPADTKSKTKFTKLRATKSQNQDQKPKKIKTRGNNPIQKMDVRVTRSKSLKKRVPKRVNTLLGSKRK